MVPIGMREQRGLRAKSRKIAFAVLLMLGVGEARVVRAAESSPAPQAADPASSPANPTSADLHAAEVDSPSTAPAGIPKAAASESPQAVTGKENAEPNAPVAPPASESDSFSSEDAGETEQQRRLDLYGFADLSYSRVLASKSNPWSRAVVPNESFSVGNFNLYLSSTLGDSWRALGEVRFMYLPNGSTTVNPNSGEITRTDTTVRDYTGFDEPIRWGGIRIERVWVEHEFSSLFKLQVGAFLTPYGIWNVDHGSPVIIGINKPFCVSEELFPAHQTGLQLYGNTFFDPFEIGYHVTLSNGRGSVEYQDFNDDKALGGRIYLKTDAFGSLTIGSSAYRGGYYDRTAKYVITTLNGHPLVDQQLTTTSKYEEFSFGADLKWEYDRLLVQSEFTMNDVAYAKGGRPRVQVYQPPNGFQSDYRRWGLYALLGYRTHFLQTMPYIIVQHVNDPALPIIPPTTGANLGFNIRPNPSVVLKLELSLIHFSGPGSIGLGSSPLTVASSQVAWAF